MLNRSITVAVSAAAALIMAPAAMAEPEAFDQTTAESEYRSGSQSLGCISCLISEPVGRQRHIV